MTPPGCRTASEIHSGTYLLLLSKYILKCNWTSPVVRSWLFETVSLPLGHCDSWWCQRCLRFFFLAWTQGICGHRIFWQLGFHFFPCYITNFCVLLTSKFIFHNLCCTQTFSGWRKEELGGITKAFHFPDNFLVDQEVLIQIYIVLFSFLMSFLATYGYKMFELCSLLSRCYF